MSDTPETDAFIVGRGYHPTENMWRDFARNLERQRDEARAEIERIKHTLQDSNAVHRNMLRGDIAHLPFHIWMHIEGLSCPPGFVPEAEAQRLREALECFVDAAKIQGVCEEMQAAFAQAQKALVGPADAPDKLPREGASPG